ncbi:hypothetical protein QFC20_007031 [Naganishia adeliensis]|uniref:Uncharacterized protein n=1 Tax=Naganishia adeliensis TaxID=92952 RepID=A0ACC2V394_9TREE|nr:hypothetical protein QFC20_007031 [Naganishia adeliensis]
MATHPPSPPYAHLAPRPQSPPPSYPYIPSAASFLASYSYAVPLCVEESWEDEYGAEEKQIISASAFLGHQPQKEEEGWRKEEAGNGAGYVLQDVRASLFPGQQFPANGCGVQGDHTWSADRGWTGPKDLSERPNPEAEKGASSEERGSAIDMGYLTDRLGSLAATRQELVDQPLQGTTNSGRPARVIRRGSGTASRSLSRQSSVRRATNAINNSAQPPPPPPQQQPSGPAGEMEEPMSPASAFLSHFSPPPTHAQAMNIPHPTTDPGDITSEFSLSRIGSPTRYGEHEASFDAPIHVFGPMGVMTGSHPTSEDALALGPRRSFSTSTTSGSWVPPHHLAMPPVGGMTMSTISSSSGFTHHFGTSSAPPDGAGAQVLGYTLGKVIGRGGFSTVRLAIDQHTGERYACRIIKRDDLSDQSGSLENFEIELEIWEEVSRVRYPRILPLLEKWRDPEGYATYLITPLMARGSLLDVIRREGGSEETARRWFPGIVEAVKALHCGWTGKDKNGAEQHAQGGYLHGDLKLDNFLVGSSGEICVCDFGLAQRIGAKPASAGDERRGRREERRIILHSREASPERTVVNAVAPHLTPTGSRHPSRSRPRFHSPYVSTTDADILHHAHHQHASRPSLPAFPVSSQLLHDRHHRSSQSRGRDPSPSPRGRRASRSRTRRGGASALPVPVQTFPSASLPYASPELLRAPPSPPDFAQDIWALGIILHALLTSRLPFVDAFDPRLQMKIIRGDWVIPPGLGREWTECLMGCLEVDPRRRWDIETLAASDAVQGWQEAKSRSKSRSRSRARARSGQRVDLSTSPTDRLGTGDVRARSRSRNRTDYFHDAGRTGRTRSRSNPAIAKIREQGGYSHYDSPLELVPETEQPSTVDEALPLGHSPPRSRSSQNRHVFGTGMSALAAHRDGDARHVSSRSRSRDPVAVVRREVGNIPAPQMSPVRNRGRTVRDS